MTYLCCNQHENHASDCVVLQMQKVKAAWKEIIKWMHVGRLPVDHPLRQMQRAVAAQRKSKK